MTAPTDTTSTEQPAEQLTEETGPQGQTPAGESTDAKPAGSGSTLTHEQAIAELTRVRGEAANYRTRLREAETKLGAAKTAEEFEAAIADVKAQNAALEATITRNDIARKYGLPDDLAARLRGDTAEELDTDAKALQKYAVARQPDSLSGGLNPTDTDEPFDPVKEARKARAARR